MAKKPNTDLASNKKAFHNYIILEKLEAGIVLQGCEVKSIRAREMTIKDAFARIINGEMWLFNGYIKPYPQATGVKPDPTRDRKLLLKKSEIIRIEKKLNTQPLVLVPLSVYLSKQKVKVKLGLGQPKKLHDKRHDLKERHAKREMDRAVKGNL